MNVLSCLTTTSGEGGATRLLIDNLNKAKKSLHAAGLSYTEADAIQVELPNTPSALGKFAAKLADKGINITLGYQTSAKGSKGLFLGHRGGRALAESGQSFFCRYLVACRINVVNVDGTFHSALEGTAARARQLVPVMSGHKVISADLQGVRLLSLHLDLRRSADEQDLFIR